MADESVNKVESTAVEMERLTNQLGSGADLGELAEKMTDMHRYLQQSFTRGFVLKFVGLMAKKYRDGAYDSRNEYACRVCHEMWETCKEKFGYKDDERTGRPIV